MIAAVLTVLATVFLYVCLCAQVWWWADKCEAEWRRPPVSDFTRAVRTIEHQMIRFGIALGDALTPALNEMTEAFRKFGENLAEAMKS